MLRDFARRAYKREMNGSSPDVVVQAIQHALTAERPCTRYRVGEHPTLLATLARFCRTDFWTQFDFRITGMPTEFSSMPPLVEDRLTKHAASDRVCISEREYYPWGRRGPTRDPAGLFSPIIYAKTASRLDGIRNEQTMDVDESACWLRCALRAFRRALSAQDSHHRSNVEVSRHDQ